MTAWLEPLTLDALLTDPMTLMVMRSDNITLADMARICRDARRAVEAHEAASSARAGVPWHVWPPRYHS